MIETKQGEVEKRILLLTDVEDNSIEGEFNFVQTLSNSDVHTTIIGVSDAFNSKTCEKLIEVKGFNYLCAVEDSDLIKHLVDHFDYTFFPCTFDTVINLESE